MKRNAAPATVDAYLARLDGVQRSALERLRRTIRSVIPGAEVNLHDVHVDGTRP